MKKRSAFVYQIHREDGLIKPVYNITRQQRYESVSEAVKINNISFSCIRNSCTRGTTAKDGCLYAFIDPNDKIRLTENHQKTLRNEKPTYIGKSTQKVKNLITGTIYNSSKEAAQKYGVSYVYMRRCITDTLILKKKYIFCYLNKDGTENITNAHQAALEKMHYKMSKLNQFLKGACIKGQAKNVKKLIAQGADVNSRNEYGMTPLHYAATLSTDEVAKLLIEAGADVYAKSDQGFSPLIEAEIGEREEVRNLIYKERNKINGLMLACCTGNLEDAKNYIKQGVNVNGKDQYGGTLLDMAASYANLKLVKLLINHGAKITIQAFNSAIRAFVNPTVPRESALEVAKFLKEIGGLEVEIPPLPGRNVIVRDKKTGDIKFTIYEGNEEDKQSTTFDTFYI
jgi:hypothetical protein